MSGAAIALVSLAAGLLGSLGMGAGAVLLLYLRVFAGVEQFTAQGINLLFFLPVAALSVLLHARKKLISWRAAGFCVLAGLPMAFLGVWAGSYAGGSLLSKLFGGMLAVIGVKELLFKEKKEK